MSDMTHEMLISELRRKSDKRIAEIRKRAEREAEAARLRKEEQLEATRKAMAGKIAEEKRSAAAALVRAAEQDAATKIDDAWRTLGDRLFKLARQQLDQVRESDYDAVFAGLVAELPPAAWEKIRVAPLDGERALTAFPGAEISVDDSITGGFAAETDQGRFTVVSTLRKRLEKVWPYVLPALLREIEEENDAFHAD